MEYHCSSAGLSPFWKFRCQQDADAAQHWADKQLVLLSAYRSETT